MGTIDFWLIGILDEDFGGRTGEIELFSYSVEILLHIYQLQTGALTHQFKQSLDHGTIDEKKCELARIF